MNEFCSVPFSNFFQPYLPHSIPHESLTEPTVEAAIRQADLVVAFKSAAPTEVLILHGASVFRSITQGHGSEWPDLKVVAVLIEYVQAFSPITMYYRNLIKTLKTNAAV